MANATATMVVPPVYEAQLFGRGYDYVEISARLVKLRSIATGAVVKKSYKAADNVLLLTFAELVEFVLGK